MVSVSVAVLVGSLTASLFVLTGLVVGVFGVELSAPVASNVGTWTAASAFFAVGFLMLFVSAFVYRLHSWSRPPAVLLHTLSTVAFGYVLATVGVEVVPLVFGLSNAIATVGLLHADDVFATSRTDTSEMHATDIGTGMR